MMTDSVQPDLEIYEESLDIPTSPDLSRDVLSPFVTSDEHGRATDSKTIKNDSRTVKNDSKTDGEDSETVETNSKMVVLMSPGSTKGMVELPQTPTSPINIKIDEASKKPSLWTKILPAFVTKLIPKSLIHKKQRRACPMASLDTPPPSDEASAFPKAPLFFSIPREIRDQIYRLLLGDQVIIILPNRHLGKKMTKLYRNGQGSRIDYRERQIGCRKFLVTHRLLSPGEDTDTISLSPLNLALRGGNICLEHHFLCGDCGHGPTSPHLFSLSLAFVCRQTYHETGPIIYSHNRFSVLWNLFPMLFNLRTPNQLTALRHLHLEGNILTQSDSRSFGALMTEAAASMTGVQYLKLDLELGEQVALRFDMEDKEAFWVQGTKAWEGRLKYVELHCCMESRGEKGDAFEAKMKRIEDGMAVLIVRLTELVSTESTDGGRTSREVVESVERKVVDGRLVERRSRSITLH
ncbi:hypothetical protein MMC13_000468 [Lambiella insularis]|nr:hypothetical protein [Lambiella insularis]